MDKLKPTLEALKKHHFWILCGLILLLTLGCWYYATRSLAATFTKRKSEIDRCFSAMAAIAGDSKQPNDRYIKYIEEQREKVKERVVAAWGYLYEEQRKNNPLPEVLRAAPGFEAEFARLWGPLGAALKEYWGPLEKIDPGKELMEAKYRNLYLNHIEQHLHTLDTLIDRRHDVDERGKPAVPRPGEGDAATVRVGIVEWDLGDMQRIKSRFSQGRSVPSTMDVLLAQEDLWVYETLLRVIQQTNNIGPDPKKPVKPAGPQEARIKRIITLAIGRDALQGSRDEQNPGGPGLPEGAGKSGPLAGRYVDDKGHALADPTQQPYAEFRMMPVNLRLIVEQNSIPVLLERLAASNMPIEVRAVRLLIQRLSMFGDPSGGGGVVVGGHHGPVAGGGGEVASGASEFQQDELAGDAAVPTVPIEISGIIYIYNPPDREKLGTGAATLAAQPKAAPAQPKPAAAPAAAGGTASAAPAGGTAPVPAGGTAPAPAGGTAPAAPDTPAAPPPTPAPPPSPFAPAAAPAAAPGPAAAPEAPPGGPPAAPPTPTAPAVPPQGGQP